MSVEINPTAYVIRIFGEGNSYDNEDSYKAVVSLSMLDKQTAYLYGANGEITRDEYRDIHNKMRELGINKFYMRRHGKLIERNL